MRSPRHIFAATGVLCMLCAFSSMASAMPTPPPPRPSMVLGPIASGDIEVDGVVISLDCGRRGVCDLRIEMNLRGIEDGFSLDFFGIPLSDEFEVSASPAIEWVEAEESYRSCPAELEREPYETSAWSALTIRGAISGEATLVLRSELAPENLIRDWWGFVWDPTQARHAITSTAAGERAHEVAFVWPAELADTQVQTSIARTFEVFTTRLPAVGSAAQASGLRTNDPGLRCLGLPEGPLVSESVRFSRAERRMLHGGPRLGLSSTVFESEPEYRARVGWDFAHRPTWHWPGLELEFNGNGAALIPTYAVATPHVLILPSPTARIGFPITYDGDFGGGVRVGAGFAMMMMEFTAAVDVLRSNGERSTRGLLLVDLSI